MVISFHSFKPEEEEEAVADKDEEFKAEEGTGKVATGEETNHSRDEIIKINLTMHLIYISHCIKPDDLVHYLHCYSDGNIYFVKITFVYIYRLFSKCIKPYLITRQPG